MLEDALTRLRRRPNPVWFDLVHILELRVDHFAVF